MAAPLCRFFLWMLLLFKCHCEDITLTTSTELKLVFLTRYGYEFTPSPDTSSFTFRVRACEDVHVGLAESKDDMTTMYHIIIGGWNNKKHAIGRLLDPPLELFTSTAQNGELSCNHFRSFWISWRNDGEVLVGLGEVTGQDIFLNVTDQTYQYQVRHVGICTLHTTGEWIFPRRYIGGQKWQVLPKFVNIVVTAGIEWAVEAKNPAACAFKCRQQPPCESFVFNAEKRFCQGHNQNFQNVTAGKGHVEQGSYYFTKV